MGAAVPSCGRESQDIPRPEASVAGVHSPLPGVGEGQAPSALAAGPPASSEMQMQHDQP